MTGKDGSLQIGYYRILKADNAFKTAFALLQLRYEVGP